jgi:hypothetical protein
MGRRAKVWPNTYCPRVFCWAKPGEPCVSISGKRASHAHQGRPFYNEEEWLEYQAHLARVRREREERVRNIMRNPPGPPGRKDSPGPQLLLMLAQDPPEEKEKKSPYSRLFGSK